MKSLLDIKNDLEGLFPDAKVEVVHKVHKSKIAISVKITAMYERPVISQFNNNLRLFFNAVQLAVGSSEIALHQEVNDSGCETCDYGSEYGWEIICSGFDK